MKMLSDILKILSILSLAPIDHFQSFALGT